MSGTKIFISYARRDSKTLAERLHDDLIAAGYDVWLDTSEIEGGANWAREIEQAIDRCDVMLALLSPAAYQSEICRNEQTLCRDKGKRLIPLLVLPDTPRPVPLYGLNYRDFSDLSQYPTMFQLLLEDLVSGKSPTSRHDLFPSEIRDYLNSLRRNFDYPYISLAAKVHQSPIRPTYSLLPKIQHTSEGNETIEELADVFEAVEKLEKFVLLGAPGGGKTTTLLHLEQKAASDYNITRRIPLLIRLSEWLPENEFEEFLQAQWIQRGLPGKIADACILLLLDGLNELREKSSSRIEDIKKTLLPNLEEPHKREFDWHVVVTCRQNDYDSSFDIGLPRVVIEVLQPGQIFQYLELRECNELKDRLTFSNQGDHSGEFQTDLDKGNEQPYLGYDLVQNPYMLTIIADTYMDAIQTYGAASVALGMLKNRGRLFASWVRSLWEREQKPHVRPTHFDLVPSVEVMEYVLSELAFRMIEEEQGTSINAEFALQAMPDKFNNQNINKPLLLRLAESASLIAISADRFTSIQFKHQLIQEYFAALAIQRRISHNPKHLKRFIGLDRVYFPRGDGRRSAQKWDEVLLMLAGIVDDLDVFLENLFSVEPFFVAEVCRTVQVRGAFRKKLLDHYLNILQEYIDGKHQDEKFCILAVDALGKLPALENVRTLVEFEQEHRFSSETHQALYRAYQNTADIYGLQALLKRFPTANKRYPNQKIVWVWIRHPRYDFYFDHRYVTLQQLASSDENDQEELRDIIPFSSIIEAEVSDIETTVEILRECYSKELWSGLSLLQALAYPPIVELMLEWGETAFQNSTDWTETFLEIEIAKALLKNKCTRSEDVLRALKNSSLKYRIIGLIGDYYQFGEKTISSTLLAELQTHDVAAAIVEAASTIESRDTRQTVRVGFWASRALGGMLPEIGLPALADLFVRCIAKAGIDLPDLVAQIENNRQAVQLPISLQEKLIQLADADFANLSDEKDRISALAAKVLGALKQQDAIPTLIQATRQNKPTHAIALGYMGLSDTVNDKNIIDALVDAFRQYRHPSVALALGMLRVEEAIEELVNALYQEIQACVSTKYYWTTRGGAYAKALGDVGLEKETVIEVLERALTFEPLNGFKGGGTALLRQEAAAALYFLIGEKAAETLSISLVQLTTIEISQWESGTFELAQSLANLTERIGNKSPGVIARFITYVSFLQAFEGDETSVHIQYIQSEYWPKAYRQAIQILGHLQNEAAVPTLRKILADKRGYGVWEDSIGFLRDLGTDEAIDAICTVYFNRRGMHGEYNPDGAYDNGTHDKLCGLATKAIIQIGTASAFRIFMQNLNLWLQERSREFPRDGWGDEEEFWFSKVSDQLHDLAEPGVFRNFIQQWLTVDIMHGLRYWFTERLNWSKSTFRILEEEINITPVVPEGAYELLEDLKKRLTTQLPQIDPEKQLPSLAKCIELLKENTIPKKEQRGR